MSLYGAPPGASAAECDVCGALTLLRLPVGDGHVPLCNERCESAWPRIARLRKVADAARDLPEDIEYLLRIIENEVPPIDTSDAAGAQCAFYFDVNRKTATARAIALRAALDELGEK